MAKGLRAKRSGQYRATKDQCAHRDDETGNRAGDHDAVPSRPTAHPPATDVKRTTSDSQPRGVERKTNSAPAVNATASYYGPMPPDPAAYDKAKSPILGLYGGNDQRVNANIPVAEAELKKHGAAYSPNIFEGAGHGFLRNQTGQDGANLKAVQQAWPKTLGFLRQYTDGTANKSQ